MRNCGFSVITAVLRHPPGAIRFSYLLGLFFPQKKTQPILVLPSHDSSTRHSGNTGTMPPRDRPDGTRITIRGAFQLKWVLLIECCKIDSRRNRRQTLTFGLNANPHGRRSSRTWWQATYCRCRKGKHAQVGVFTSAR